MAARNQDTIIAYKGNLTQEFTRVSWEVMGTDKYGWSLIPEVPKEVREAVLVNAPTMTGEFRITPGSTIVGKSSISVDTSTAPSEQPATLIKEDVEAVVKPAERKPRGRRKK